MEAGTQQSPLDVSRGTATAAANCSTLRIWAARISFFDGRRRGDLFASVDRYVRRVDFRAHTC